MFNRNRNRNQKAKVEVEKSDKVTWIKSDGETEIELFDTPNLTKKAKELGWKRKG